MDLHGLAEARSLAIHREIADWLLHDSSILARARATLQRWVAEDHISPDYANAWDRWLSQSPQEIAALLTDEGDQARALRQTIWRAIREQTAG